MSFLETPRFPENVSFQATGGPGYSTDIVVTDSGAELRNQNWSQARAKWDVSHAARLQADWATLLAFFRAVKGKAIGFRFKDWSDYSVTSSQGVFASLTATTFQMYRNYTQGALTESRKITKPVSGTVAVTGGVSPTVDYTTGIVTVSSGTPTAWSGQFDVPCRFDTDDMKGEIIDKSGSQFVMGWNQIPVIELRL